MTNPVELLSSALEERYAVERELGQGGMATVYLAQDLKHERKVAIKVLRPELSMSLGADRFLREIRVAATLQHPNILGLYDSGEANGLLYYVMPFIEGESLRDRLNREQQLPIHDALQITRESAEALAYAHEHGIVHRDIKPENILLQQGHALVADFGIARAVSQAGGEKLTQTGMAVGTPHYMSPEQSLGSDHVDARSDVYSLGCVLYELLVGEPPFQGPNAMAIMARHSMETVPSLQVVRQSVPDEVEDAVMHALEKTPADRFQTMREFTNALVDAEAEAAMIRTSARRVATASRRVPTREMRAPEAPPPKKRLILYAGIAAALLALLGGGFFALRSRGAAAKPSAESLADFKRVAVLYFEDESPKHSLAYLSDGLTEDLIKELSTVQGLEVTSRNGVNAFRDPSIPRDSVARALKVGTIVAGSVEPAGANKVRVTARLVDASGTEFKRSSFEQSTGDPIAMRDSLVGRVADFLRERLGEEVRVREEQNATKSPEAWAMLQRAQRVRSEAEDIAARGDTAGTAKAKFAEADSLARLAEEKDPSWNDPIVVRGWTYFRRSRLTNNDAVVAKPLIEKGLALADTAVQRDNTNPDALELRGSLTYWKYLLGLEPDAVAAKAMRDRARKDFEDAIKLNPQQAGAWASLAHIYARTGSMTDVVLAARRAYEADAYLSNANTILGRLFDANYDLNQSVDAQHWCEEGYRRFPKDPAFTICQIEVMTMRGQEPNVEKAWRLAESDVVKSDPRGGTPGFKMREARIYLAAVLARAGLKDSAKAVIKASRSLAEDPLKDLALFEAFALTLAGDKPAAIAAIKSYLVVNPDRAKDLADESVWWFRDLAQEPEFQKAVGIR